MKSSVTAAAPPPAVVFDPDRAERRLGGDRRLLQEMIAIFRAESPGQMATIRRAAMTSDLEALRRAAHSLKGALGTLDAPHAYQAVQRLETAARQGDTSDVQPALRDLELAMTALARAITPARRRTHNRRKGATHAVPHQAVRSRARRRR